MDLQRRRRSGSVIATGASEVTLAHRVLELGGGHLGVDVHLSFQLRWLSVFLNREEDWSHSLLG